MGFVGRQRASAPSRSTRAATSGIAVAFVVLLSSVISSTANAAAPNPYDPDQAAKVSTDVNTSLLVLGGGEYQLLIQNQSALGSIDSFAWVPGPGWRITSVIRTTGGKCTLNAGALSCDGKIPPPTICTCLPGGRMTVVFKMSGPHAPPPSKARGNIIVGTAGGYFVVRSVTLINRHIPTALPPANT
jgi:hypothetical protein